MAAPVDAGYDRGRMAIGGSLDTLQAWAADRAERDADPHRVELWRQIAGEIDAYLHPDSEPTLW